MLETWDKKEAEKNDKLQAVKIHQLEGHTETVEFCKFDASGKWMATGGMNN